MNITEAIEEFDLSLRGEVAARTRKTYLQRLGYLARYFDQQQVAEISSGDLRRWRVELLERGERYQSHTYRPNEQGGLSRQTVKGLIKAAKRLFKFLHAEGIIKTNPATTLRNVKPAPQEPKALSQEDLQKLIATSKDNPRNHAIVLFLADTGCRVGGLVGLKVQDVDMERRRALVTEKGRVRLIMWGEPTNEALRAWISERGGAAGPLWLSERGGGLTVYGIYRMLKRLGEQAGVARCNPHAFRHGLAVGLLNEGANLALVSEIMGHQQMTTTRDFYARWDVEAVARQKESYSWLPEE